MQTQESYPHFSPSADGEEHLCSSPGAKCHCDGGSGSTGKGRHLKGRCRTRSLEQEHYFFFLLAY